MWLLKSHHLISTILRRSRSVKIGRLIACQFMLCLACMWLAVCGMAGRECSCGRNRQLILLSSDRLLDPRWSDCQIFIFFPSQLDSKVYGLQKVLKHRTFYKELLSNLQHWHRWFYLWWWQQQWQYNQIVNLVKWHCSFWWHPFYTRPIPWWQVSFSSWVQHEWKFI